MSASEKVARKETRLVDVRVVVEFDLRHDERAYAWVHGEPMPIQRRVETLEQRVKEFEQFLRDHRSQDEVEFFVERIHEDRCSACGESWEINVAEQCCAWCGTGIGR